MSFYRLSGFANKTYFAVGILLFAFFYWLVLHKIAGIWITQQNVILHGVYGDQAFYLWALERARNVAPYYDEFINHCSWNSSGCINLTAFPLEWPSLYFIGNIGLLAGLNTYDTMNAWYLGSLVLNGLAAAFFLSQFVKSPVFYFCLAPFAALQLSLTVRLAGHFSLVAAWPMFLFLGFLIKILRSSISPSVKPRWTTALGFTAATFCLTQVSFYYFIFSMVIAVIAGCVFSGLYIKKISAKTVAPLLKQSMPAIIALCTGLWIISYTFLPDESAKDQKTFNRTSSDVSFYSARWTDFIFPLPADPAYPLLKKIGIVSKPEWFKDRSDETCNYLGDVILFVFVSAVAALLLSILLNRKKSESIPFPVQDAFFLLVMLAATLFLTTADGGILVHFFFPSLRCFNRLVPLAALFATAFAAVILEHTLKSPAAKTAFFGIVFFIGFYEFSSQWALNPARMVSIQDSLVSISRLAKVCKSHTITVSPAIADYPRGPFPLYFWAEAANCRISNISGPGFKECTDASQKKRPSAVVKWKENPNMAFPQITDIILQ
jgi:hypothetical protein